MAITPLMLLAFQLNYRIQNSIFKYQQPFQWNSVTRKFSYATSEKNLIPWHFANCFLLPWILFNNIVLLTIYWTSDSLQFKLFHVLLFLIQSLAVIILLATCCRFYIHADDWISFLNNLMDFSNKLQNEEYQKNKRDSILPKNRLVRLPEIHAFVKIPRKLLILQNGNIDIIGIIGNLTVISFAVLNILLPPFVLVFRFDAPGHFFRLIFPSSWYSCIFSRCLIEILRAVICSWGISEGVNTLRSYALYGFAALSSYSEMLTILSKHSFTVPTLLKYHCINIIFALMEDSHRYMLPVYMGCLYFLIILINTVAILGTNILDWHFYLSVPAAGLFGLVIVLVVWQLAVLSEEKSNQLKLEWKPSWRNQDKTGFNKASRLRMQRYWRSMKPVAVQIGNFGKMTKDARKKYFNAMLCDNVTLILTLSEYVDIFD